MAILEEDLSPLPDKLQVAFRLGIPGIGIGLQKPPHALLGDELVGILLVVFALGIDSVRIRCSLQHERLPMHFGAGRWSRVNRPQLDRLIQVGKEGVIREPPQDNGNGDQVEGSERLVERGHRIQHVENGLLEFLPIIFGTGHPHKDPDHRNGPIDRAHAEWDRRIDAVLQVQDDEDHDDSEQHDGRRRRRVEVARRRQVLVRDVGAEDRLDLAREAVTVNTATKKASSASNCIGIYPSTNRIV